MWRAGQRQAADRLQSQEEGDGGREEMVRHSDGLVPVSEVKDNPRLVVTDLIAR